METLKEIVKGSVAQLTHVCNGKVYFRIDNEKHSYQLEIDSLDSEWKNIYVLPAYNTITLMRWIRESLEKQDDKFIQLK